MKRFEIIQRVAWGSVIFSMIEIAVAGSGVVDWESGSQCAMKWLFSGLQVTNTRGTICASVNNNLNNGTTTSNDLAGMSVTHVNGLAFTPISIDLGEYSQFVSDSTVYFIGYKPGGATVSASFDLDGIADGSGGAADFQNFVFPPDFSDIIRLEVPNTLWSCDNLAFSTIIPPEFSSELKSETGFLSATLLYSKPLLDDIFIIGSGFEFISGFRPYSPTKAKLLPPEGSATLGSIYSPSYDRSEKTLYFSQGNPEVIRKYKAGVSSNAVVLQDILNLGYSAASIYDPHAAGGRLMFSAGSASESGPSHVFLKENGVTTAFATLATPLPIGSTVALPAWVSGAAISPAGVAIYASLVSNPNATRLYASFANGPIRNVIGETDHILTGETYVVVNGLESCEFTTAGELKVGATLSSGKAWLFFSSGGLTRIESVTATVSPLNAGKQVTGTYYRTNSGINLLDTNGEIFREKDGGFFRLIGVGDRVLGETVSLVEFKAAPDGLPARAIVEVRYESSQNTTARILELLLDSPVIQPPRFGTSVIHPESGDLFIPLSRLTHGREYWLQRSVNLMEWEDMRRIENVLPLQHVVVSRPELGSCSFYRIEQR